MARALPAGPQARRACRPRGGGCPRAPPASASESFSAAQPRAVRRHDFPVATAAGLHLFPSRTEKLSPPAPMVLPLVGRESRSPPISAPPEPHGSGGAFFMPAGQMPPGSAAGVCRSGGLACRARIRGANAPWLLRDRSADGAALTRKFMRFCGLVFHAD